MTFGVPQDEHPPSAVIGVNLKSYFGYRQTLEWCAAVAALPELRSARDSRKVEVFILPSFPAIAPAAATLERVGVQVGAQEISPYLGGAHTGDVPATMLAEIGCTLALTGHAERRAAGETDAIVAAQVGAAVTAGLDPVICVGEPAPMAQTDAARWCVGQLGAALARIAPTDGGGARIVVAYEPVWAIGADKPAPDLHVRHVCEALSRFLRSSALVASRSAVIYGGAAGPGQLDRLFGPAQGLFLGRFAHEVSGLARVLEDAIRCVAISTTHERIGRWT